MVVVEMPPFLHVKFSIASISELRVGRIRRQCCEKDRRLHVIGRLDVKFDHKEYFPRQRAISEPELRRGFIKRRQLCSRKAARPQCRHGSTFALIGRCYSLQNGSLEQVIDL
jgi:hypothetical protein